MVSSQVDKALKEAMPTCLITQRGTHSYDSLNSVYLSMLESDLQPDYIFQPRTKEEVGTFLRTIKAFVNDDNKFAIRGAGCQPLPGCANIQGGITMDLSLINGIVIEDGLVRIGAGEHWGAVYESLDGKGLGVSGSRSSNCGIGGLALAGGLSFFSSREGFICDNVINYEVVLASGEIINANADESADLCIALRGGGNNFGVVTRFDLRTFKQEKIWGGTVLYFAPSFPSQIEALVKELHDPNASPETHLMLSIGYASMYGTDILCMNQPYYTKAVENPPALDPFTKIQPQIDAMNTMRLHNLKDAAIEQAGAARTQVRCAYMNITVKADVAVLQDAADIYTAALEPLKFIEQAMFSFTLQPYPVSLLEKSASSGGNSLGLNINDGPLVSVLLLSYWQNKDQDDNVLEFMKTTLEKIKQDAIARNQLFPYVYMNYAFSHQDPIGSYDLMNKEQLQKVSKKYDPEGIFQRGCPGGFKLFT